MNDLILFVLYKDNDTQKSQVTCLQNDKQQRKIQIQIK